jgi:hypothetical protein
VELTLYWQATASVPARYKVFTHLVGQTYNTATGDFLWGRQDDEPANGRAVTTSWAPGMVIADPHSIPVAADTPPGRYTLEVGLYRLVDGTRLPVFSSDERPLGDAVVLAQVEVQAP